MSNIVPYNELQQMATSVAKSGMFGLKSIEQATTLMLIAQAEGIHPIQAIQKYSVIQGLPSLKSTEVQARFQKDRGTIKWIETTNKKAVCELKHPSYDGSYLSEFGEEDAKLEGLLSKDNYKRMPKAMYMARAMTRGVRAVAPDCLNNMYSVEELSSTAHTDIVADESTPTIEAPIEAEFELTPEPTIGALKLKLANKLKELSFSNGDIKGFADMHGLADNKQLLERVVNEPILLNEMVVQFEEESASE